MENQIKIQENVTLSGVSGFTALSVTDEYKNRLTILKHPNGGLTIATDEIDNPLFMPCITGIEGEGKQAIINFLSK